MSNKTIKKIQEHGLKLLSEFDFFAKENNLTYYLIGGTLLGSVRHKGFIPWDDDVDIGIPRNDYDRLVTIAHKINLPCKLECYEIDKDYIYPYAKLYDTTTTVVEKFNYSRGVWIDVFPIDGAFTNIFLQKFHLKIINKVKKYFHLNARLNQKIIILKKTDSFFRKFIKIALKSIPTSFFFTILNFLLHLKPFEKAKYVGNFLGRYGLKEIVPKDFFVKGKQDLLFEKDLYPVPYNYHAYLQAIYGDYMKIPPKNERESHENLYVNLTTSYLEKDTSHDPQTN